MPRQALPSRRLLANLPRMKIFLAATVLTSCALSVRAETTPLTAPLEEQKEITIACEITQAPKRAEGPVLSAKDCEAVKGIYHYKLWLPAGYKADDKKAWPCLFIASPGGKAGMGQMAAWIKASGYVAVMLVESKNGPWAPIAGNFLAAHDDVVKRVRIQEGLKLATGMSGGARAASLFVQMRPGFAGLVLQAAGGAFDDKGQYHVSKLKGGHGIYVAMTMGDKDSNKGEVARMKAALGASRFNAFPFEGAHGWAPQETFEKAITWVEQQLYRKSDTPAAVKKLLAPRCAAAK
jgi:hypothetical protein